MAPRLDKTRANLKTYFQTGDEPTQTDFEDLIDASPNILDDYAGILEKFYTAEIAASSSEQNVVIVPADAANIFIITSVVSLLISQTGTLSGGPTWMDFYYNGVDQNIFGGFGVPVGNGVGDTYLKNNANDLAFTGAYDLICKMPALPAGVTACTIKVIVKGFKIQK